MKYLLHVLLLIIPIISHAEIVSRDLVGKASDISLTKNFHEGTGLGPIEAQLCPTCPIYQLTITPSTVVSKDGDRFDLPKFKMQLKANGNKKVRLQFHKHTNEIFYIRLISDNGNKEILQ